MEIGRLRKRLSIFLLVATLFAFMTVTVDVAFAMEAGDFVDSMLVNFQQKFESYSQKIWNAALGLFAALFLCQFAWSILQLFLQENLSLGSILATVIRQGMIGSFFYWLLFDRTVLNAIIESFEQLGTSGLNLSDLLLIMEVAVNNIMRATGRATGALAGLAIFFTGLAASLVMSFALTTAIAFMALVQVENYIVCSLGLILLGFGGSDYTRSYTVSYIRTLVHVGFKLFLATVIVQIGVTAFHASTLNIGADNDSITQSCMRLIAQSFFFLAIVKVVPMIADSLIGGGSMSSWGGLSTVTSSAGSVSRGMGAAAAGAVSGAYNLPGKIADTYQGGRSAVQQAAGSYGSQYSAYRSQGMGSMRAGVSAFGSALWSGYQASRGGTAGVSGGNTMTAANSTASNTSANSGNNGSLGSAIGAAALGNQGTRSAGSENNPGSAEGHLPPSENVSGAGMDLSQNKTLGASEIAGDAAAGLYGTSSGEFTSRAGHGSIGAPAGSTSSLTRNPASKSSSLDVGSVPQSKGGASKVEAATKSSSTYTAPTPEELSKKFKNWN